MQVTSNMIQYRPELELITMHFLLHMNTQSITVPLQGFLNAIVYGWTREDFLYVMASTKNPRSLPNMDCSSDFEDTVKLVEDKLRVQQQDTPDTSMEI